MTTREVYFKILFESDMPVACITYTYEIKGMYHVASTNIELRTNEDVASKNIDHMKKIENTEGFMFWNNTPDAAEFFKGVKWKYTNG